MNCCWWRRIMRFVLPGVTFRRVSRTQPGITCCCNQSFDGNTTTDEVVFPEDNGREVNAASAEEVLKLLYRDGCCPEWIDIAAEAVGQDFTLLRLLCCGRFTNDLRKMYYQDRGMGPFGIKSPALPPDFAEG